ncbi:NAD(P)-binding domain-containing protein [Nocardia sp. BMG51109]|uniref:imine reductase family protein n=1 Tax=Nocardia sp. BMG51109 TaxID=1056816 RepID=UPI0004640CD6|nr:NAD(P)-binding domain-containing protein [Nocardia sp. BMG51109]
MTTVTVLGLGPMGHALAAAFAAHHPTTVWNRTPGKGTDLDAAPAGTAAEAIAASPLVIVCLPDYPVAQSVLDADALKGRTLVNFCGGSPEQARAMAAWAERHGIEYIDGVIVSTPEAIGSPEAALYYSGPRDIYETHRTTLFALGENANYLGREPGRAAAFDLALQDMLWTSMSGVTHMFAFAAAEDIAAADIAGHAKAMLGFFPDMIDMLAEQVAAGRFPGDGGTITAAAAIMDRISSAVRAQGLDDGALGAARAAVQRAIDAGYGADGFGRLAALD